MEGTNNENKTLHPNIIFFHGFFKLLAICSYLFVGYFTDVTLSRVLTILFLVLDFWVVKNITGRLLLGLRWWNYIDDDGNSIWIFESSGRKVDSGDKIMFWGFQYGFIGIWALFLLSAVITLSLSLTFVSALAIVMCSVNIYGYIKCDKDSKSRIEAINPSFFWFF